MAGGEGESLIGFEGVEGPAGGAGDLEKFLQQVIEDAAADECGDPDGQVVPAAAQAEEPPHRGGDAEDNDEIAQAGDEREEKDELRLRVEVEEFFEGLVAEPELAVMGFIGGEGGEGGPADEGHREGMGEEREDGRSLSGQDMLRLRKGHSRF